MKETSLHDVHVELGARMVEFGGWHMPVQYGPILEEARAVRARAGLFDLGHMGRFQVVGPDAVRLVDRVATNHCGKLASGTIRYSLLCNQDGGALDDLLLYRDVEGVYLVVNAANTERDLEWIRRESRGFEAEVRDLTAETAMIALQGPRSQAILQPLVEGLLLDSIKYYRFDFGTVAGIPGTRISRTGYTGEDGFELYLPTAEGPRVWRELREAGAAEGLAPVGLGARDILRLEAGMALYGHEIDETTNPFEAGLDFAIALTAEKGDFIGRAALTRMKGSRARRLVGITTEGPRVPRQGHELFLGGALVGRVSSGGVSPTLGTNIGSAYVRLGEDRAGVELELDLRGKRQACKVCELPFYSRTRKKKD
jgi:aminomethyltransferase